MAYSAGFNPHPKVSWLGASPTGVASEAEYVELALARQVKPEELRTALNDALPPDLDIIEVVEAGPGSLAERIDTSEWRIELPGVGSAELGSALSRFLEAEEVPVQRLTKNGLRSLDARAPVVSASSLADEVRCAILHLVVRHVTPAVRPDDILTGLRVVAALVPPVPPRAIRLAQGVLTAEGRLADPLAADRDADRDKADRDRVAIGVSPT
jgi:radical SAM-linked protein